MHKFSVAHYAGVACYDTKGFCDKNKVRVKALCCWLSSAFCGSALGLCVVLRALASLACFEL
jgi:hypothetical protein